MRRKGPVRGHRPRRRVAAEPPPDVLGHLAWLAGLLLAASFVHGLTLAPPVSKGNPHAI